MTRGSAARAAAQTAATGVLATLVPFPATPPAFTASCILNRAIRVAEDALDLMDPVQSVAWRAGLAQRASQDIYTLYLCAELDCPEDCIADGLAQLSPDVADSDQVAAWLRAWLALSDEGRGSLADVAGSRAMSALGADSEECAMLGGRALALIVDEDALARALAGIAPPLNRIAALAGVWRSRAIADLEPDIAADTTRLLWPILVAACQEVASNRLSAGLHRSPWVSCAPASGDVARLWNAGCLRCGEVMAAELACLTEAREWSHLEASAHFAAERDAFRGIGARARWAGSVAWAWLHLDETCRVSRLAWFASARRSLAEIRMAAPPAPSVAVTLGGCTEILDAADGAPAEARFASLCAASPTPALDWLKRTSLSRRPRVAVERLSWTFPALASDAAAIREVALGLMRRPEARVRAETLDAVTDLHRRVRALRVLMAAVNDTHVGEARIAGALWWLRFDGVLREPWGFQALTRLAPAIADPVIRDAARSSIKDRQALLIPASEREWIRWTHA